MKKILFILSLISFIFISLKIYALDISSDTLLYVSGETIGIKLNTGVKVVGCYGIRDIEDVIMPWKDSGIKDGDIIVKYNDKDITSRDTLMQEVLNTKGSMASIELKRGEEIINSSITPHYKDGMYSLGLYIKDHILGVGTLTYILPGYNIYGALGHNAISDDTYGGTIYEARVDAIKKPVRGQAGEKNATVTSDELGNIEKNTATGIHGIIDSDYKVSDLSLKNIMKRSDAHLGSASIMTVIEGTKVEFFDIEITKLKKQDKSDIKGISFEVTDESLIARCGGIVQGMSGSPIIQDDKIVGAVTHVMLNNPKEGYGVYIEFMLEEMDIYIKD